MNNSEGFKFKSRFPNIGDIFLTYEGYSKETGVNLALVVDTELHKVTYIYYDHNQDKLILNTCYGQSKYRIVFKS